MADNKATDPKPSGEVPAVPATATPTGTTAIPPRRSPGHRGADVRDTVAEMAARAQEISQEAGSRMAAAMKDVINAAAGIADFAIESARDLAQYMVRRGQMTQEEADKLIREAEAAQAGRPQKPKPPPPPPAGDGHRASGPSTASATPAAMPSVRPTPAKSATPAAVKPIVVPPPKPAVKKEAAPAPKPAAKPAAKKPAKPAPKAKAAKKPAAKKKR